MAKIYATLIKKGLKTIDDVPSDLKEQVNTILGGAYEGTGDIGTL